MVDFDRFIGHRVEMEGGVSRWESTNGAHSVGSGTVIDTICISWASADIPKCHLNAYTHIYLCNLFTVFLNLLKPIILKHCCCSSEHMKRDCHTILYWAAQHCICVSKGFHSVSQHVTCVKNKQVHQVHPLSLVTAWVKPQRDCVSMTDDIKVVFMAFLIETYSKPIIKSNILYGQLNMVIQTPVSAFYSLVSHWLH